MDIELGDIDFDENLLADIEDYERPEQEESETEAEAEPEKELFEDEEHVALAEMLVDGYEALVKTVGHERFEVEASKKIVLIGAYSKLLKKHEGRCPKWLVNYKEEMICIGVTLFVCFVTYKSVTVLKAEDKKAKKAKSTEVVKSGEKQE